ncbi:MAG: copper homeostasis protein CutC [Dysgonamonadaceae bacterium]|jgi:copper homeostasis protein|nr:copper homeostasis protein CutC [Dysgonamonadaceae bacterium]
MKTANKIVLEVCADSIQGALIAQSEGAQRIELCANLPEGGVTPSPAQIEIARRRLNIRLYVLVRPRGGDFLYDDTEMETIASDIHFCGKAGCDGVVIGALTADGAIDKKRTGSLVRIAHQYAMGVTFHRAFDRSNDLFLALEDVIDLGCERILTSGGCNTALEGAGVIRQLIAKAGERIVIMPGCGVTPENAPELIRKTGLKELHGTFRAPYPSRMQFRNTQLHSPEEADGRWMTCAKKIRTILQNHPVI